MAEITNIETNIETTDSAKRALTNDSQTVGASSFTNLNHARREFEKAEIKFLSTKAKDWSLEDKADDYLNKIEATIYQVNVARKANGLTGVQARFIHDPASIALIISTCGYYVKILTNVDDPGCIDGYIAKYDKKEGIYQYVDTEEIYKLANRVYPGFNPDKTDAVYTALISMLPEKVRSTDRDLIWFNDCILDLKTFTTQPFTPDLVSTTKLTVPWDIQVDDYELEPGYYVHDIIDSLSDDPEMVLAIKKSLYALLVNKSTWRRMSWWIGDGVNGKSMLIKMMQIILGKRTYVEVDLKQYNSDKRLDTIIGKDVLITSDIGAKEFIEPSNLKKLVVGDTISLGRLYKSNLTYTFTGSILMAMNTIPRFPGEAAVKDRIFPVRFDKSFKRNNNTKILTDYILRKDVQAWIVKDILQTVGPIETLELSTNQKRVLEGIYAISNPLKVFVVDECVLEDLMMADVERPEDEPLALNAMMAYDLFKIWAAERGHTNVAKMTYEDFKNQLLSLCKEYDLDMVVESVNKPRIYNNHRHTSGMASRVVTLLAGADQAKQISINQKYLTRTGTEMRSDMQPTTIIRMTRNTMPIIDEIIGTANT